MLEHIYCKTPFSIDYLDLLLVDESIHSRMNGQYILQRWAKIFAD